MQSRLGYVRYIYYESVVGQYKVLIFQYIYEARLESVYYQSVVGLSSVLIYPTRKVD